MAQCRLNESNLNFTLKYLDVDVNAFDIIPMSLQEDIGRYIMLIAHILMCILSYLVNNKSTEIFTVASQGHMFEYRGTIHM